MTQASEAEIYKEIKQAIIQQKLRPNMQLVEDVLAESFGVSRTPVRNVLRRLAHEKLVTIIPHKGTFVACPSVTEAKEVFEMRQVLETAAIRKACNRLDEAEISQFKAMLEAEKAAHTRGDLLETLQISCDFHLKIAKLAGNSYYYRYLEELISLNYVIMSFYGHRQLTLCGCQEHALILDAMIEKDTTRAEQLMLEHLKHIEACLDFGDSHAATASLADLFKNRTR